MSADYAQGGGATVRSTTHVERRGNVMVDRSSTTDHRRRMRSLHGARAPLAPRAAAIPKPAPTQISTVDKKRLSEMHRAAMRAVAVTDNTECELAPFEYESGHHPVAFTHEDIPSGSIVHTIATTDKHGYGITRSTGDRSFVFGITVVKDASIAGYQHVCTTRGQVLPVRVVVTVGTEALEHGDYLRPSSEHPGEAVRADTATSLRYIGPHDARHVLCMLL